MKSALIRAAFLVAICGDSFAASTNAENCVLHPLHGKGHITSWPGERFHPILKRWKPHNGLDIGTPVGTPVFASEAGVVQEKFEAHGGGNILKVLPHPENTTVGSHEKYMHLSRYVVRMGDKVAKNQLIAYSGNTGGSTGPHLHFEYWLRGAPQIRWTMCDGESPPAEPQDPEPIDTDDSGTAVVDGAPTTAPVMTSWDDVSVHELLDNETSRRFLSSVYYTDLARMGKHQLLMDLNFQLALKSQLRQMLSLQHERIEMLFSARQMRLNRRDTVVRLERQRSAAAKAQGEM